MAGAKPSRNMLPPFLLVSSWQMIFWVLVAVGLGTAFGVLCIADTLAPALRSRPSAGESIAVYAAHLANGRLMTQAGVLGFNAAGIFAYVTGSSFVFIGHYALSPATYALIFAAGIVGIMITSAVNRRVVGRFGAATMLRVGTVVGSVTGLFLILQTTSGWGGLPAFAAGLFVFVATNGLVGANAIAGGLSLVGRGTGAASALLGFAQYGGGMLGSTLVGLLADGTPVPMAAIIGVTSVAATSCALLSDRRRG